MPVKKEYFEIEGMKIDLDEFYLFGVHLTEAGEFRESRTMKWEQENNGHEREAGTDDESIRSSEQ